MPTNTEATLVRIEPVLMPKMLRKPSGLSISNSGEAASPCQAANPSANNVTNSTSIFRIPPTEAVFIPPKKAYRITNSSRIPADIRGDSPVKAANKPIPGRILDTALNIIPKEVAKLVIFPAPFP